MGKDLFKLEVKKNKCKDNCLEIKKDDKLKIKSDTLCLKLCKKKCKKVLEINLPCESDIIAAQFHTNGNAGLVPVTPGQPITFNITDVSNSDIVLTNALVAPFTIPGSFFNIKKKGLYQINFQVPYPEDAAVILYLGATIASLAPLSYTLVGKTTDNNITGSFIVNVPNNNSYIALVASPTNVNNIVIPATSSTTNAANTNISFVKL